MNEKEYINYTQVAEVIKYILRDATERPCLEKVAEKVNLSPFQFQQLFTEWVGVHPEVFLHFINAQHTKQLLSSSLTTLFCTAHKKELTETGRPHGHCVKIEVMTPREYKNEGEHLTINYSFSTSRFGYVLIASTYKGICYMGFSDDDEIALEPMLIFT